MVTSMTRPTPVGGHPAMIGDNGVGRLSSVPSRVERGMTNQEMEGGLITKKRAEGGRLEGEGHSEI
jgi:hypothetical protein